MLAFFSVATLVMVSMHRYLWRRLVRDPSLSRPWQRGLTALVWLLGLTLPAAFAARRWLPRPAVQSISSVAYVWLGLLFYLVLLWLTVDVWRGARASPRWLRDRLRAWRHEPTRSTRSTPNPNGPYGSLIDPSRRAFLARSMAGGTTLAASGICGWGLHRGLGDITTPEVPVRLERLPPALSGFRIALLSDVHIGPLLGRGFLRGVVEKTLSQKPDLIAITGDLVDGRVSEIGSQVAELGRLRAPHGVFFVTGNHEYYSGASEWIAFLRRLGIQVLMNQRVVIGDHAARFDLAGIPDAHAGSYHPVAADVSQALRGRDVERELVMLAHQPVQIAQVAEHGAGLQLSGHTHGGQLFPFGMLTGLVQPYVQGLHRHQAGTQIYVSKGTGFWGPPMRVLAPAEITSIVLTS